MNGFQYKRFDLTNPVLNLGFISTHKTVNLLPQYQVIYKRFLGTERIAAISPHSCNEKFSTHVH